MKGKHSFGDLERERTPQLGSIAEPVNGQTVAHVQLCVADPVAQVAHDRSRIATWRQTLGDRPQVVAGLHDVDVADNG